jgi:hypothetical protein
MSFGSVGGSSSISGASDVLLSSPTDSQVLAYNSASSKWNNQTPTAGSGGGVPTTYALGRVKYTAGWPSTRPTGYAYIDWIKSSTSDPDPSAGAMIAGDTISEWQ